MKKITLNKFEADVMNKLLSGEHWVLEELRSQLNSSELVSREFTGVGIFLQFLVPLSCPKIDKNLGTKKDFSFGDFGGRIGNPPTEVGFVIWVKDGRLSSLEGYTFGNANWPSEVGNYELYNIRKTGRDLDSLAQTWKV